MLVTLCWWEFSGVGDRISRLMTTFGSWYPILYRILVTNTAKTVIYISKLSPTHFVFNIRHQHQYSQLDKIKFWISKFLKDSCAVFLSFEHFRWLQSFDCNYYNDQQIHVSQFWIEFWGFWSWNKNIIWKLIYMYTVYSIP